VTTAVTARLYSQGRISPDQLTVSIISGNGLKTTDALVGQYAQEAAVKPKLAAFDEYIREVDASLVGGDVLELAGGVR